jgi:hypothetical protein
MPVSRVLHLERRLLDSVLGNKSQIWNGLEFKTYFLKIIFSCGHINNFKNIFWPMPSLTQHTNNACQSIAIHIFPLPFTLEGFEPGTSVPAGRRQLYLHIINGEIAFGQCISLKLFTNLAIKDQSKNCGQFLLEIVFILPFYQFLFEIVFILQYSRMDCYMTSSSESYKCGILGILR